MNLTKFEEMLKSAGYVVNDATPESLGQKEYMKVITGRFIIIALGKGDVTGDEGCYVNFKFHPSSGDFVSHSCGKEEDDDYE